MTPSSQSGETWAGRETAPCGPQPLGKAGQGGYRIGRNRNLKTPKKVRGSLGSLSIAFIQERGRGWGLPPRHHWVWCSEAVPTVWGSAPPPPQLGGCGYGIGRKERAELRAASHTPHLGGRFGASVLGGRRRGLRRPQ